MLAKIRGEGDGLALFVPRLDIWYNYNHQNNSLPPRLKGKDLLGVTEELNVGLHAVIPDYVRGVTVEDIVHRGLGCYNNPDFPFIFDFSEIDFDYEVKEKEIVAAYHTGRGDITLRFEWGEEFLRSGISIPAMKEHPIKEEKDYYALGEIFSKVKIVERLSGYDGFYNRVGDRGLAVCCTTLAAGPMAHIHRNLRRMDDFFLDQYDCPEAMEHLAEALSPLYDEVLSTAAKTRAEVIIFGANYDDMITIPPLFREHFMPWLSKAGELFHEKGKFLLTHTDGENQGLLESYMESNFDIADSVTPAPMTKVSLKEYRDYFDGKIAIWGGIPSAIMMENSYSWDDFVDWFENTMKEIHPYDHLILSIADTCPAKASFDRLEFLCERLNASDL